MRLLLLRTMIAKEWRTTWRERNQLVGLAISLAAMVVGIALPAFQARNSLAARIVVHLQWTPEMLAIAKWIPVAIGTGVAFFFDLGFLLAAIMGSFAGEKENRTLELALVSPVSDTMLFLSKCISVLIPSAVVGMAFTAMAALAAQLMLGKELGTLPFAWWFYLIALSFPPALLMTMFLVGIGAAISARAETAKGAGQVMGGVFFTLTFGLSYGVPLLVQRTWLRNPVMALINTWLTWPFWGQYLGLLAALAAPAMLAVVTGRLMFRRDRLLT